ncbi:hypothetical protein L1987_45822 [Smallanthus sonchifolius]|uniref:Uncharacterized protein n=1 Tax=Smallanthus sonchifolius TaxID=185202 RepID=A0ACB9FY22_9ASTR|nr:hypothetical protein L1987_45822 [Smallanthus sonchifolius]
MAPKALKSTSIFLMSSSEYFEDSLGTSVPPESAEATMGIMACMLGEERCGSLLSAPVTFFLHGVCQCCSRKLSVRSALRCNHPNLLMIFLSAASSVDAAEKPIRSNSGLQQLRLSAADLFFSRRTIHTDDNYANLFTKAFDHSRFEHLVNMIGMFNPE